MRWRSRWLALLTLVLHGAALVGLPLLHERSHQGPHARHHVHLGTQTAWGGHEAATEGAIGDHEDDRPDAEAASGEPLQPASLHESHDADLAALDLLDVGHAGVAVVDCELVRYTLAACASPEAVAHGFGDELLARSPHRHHQPTDGPAPWEPGHGAHSLEHGGLAVTQTPPFLLSPPLRACAPMEPAPPRLLSGFSPHLALRARAPPPVA